MTIHDLKQNIEVEKELIREIFIFTSQLRNLERLYPYEKREYERRILMRALNSSIERLKMVNKSIPEILNKISFLEKPELERKEEKTKNLVKVNYIPEIFVRKEKKKEDEGKRNITATIEKKERRKFLKELKLSKETLKRLKKAKPKEEKVERVEFLEFKKASWYARISNKIFLKLSTSFSDKGKLKKLNSNLRKANMSFLVTTYLSMAFLSTLLAFVVGLIIFVILSIFTTADLISILRNSLIIFILPILTFFSFYFYPYAERKSIEGKINSELPFVTIHMSAIAGSGIEPTQIFKIIVLSEEYPNTKKELKKVINQVNVYGYDLVTALKNTARETSSKKLSELFNGIATTISGGGSLPEFLDKRAETLLFEYRLEREKKTKSAETFMDIYISIVIAAPMIMTLLLILISISGMGIGLSLSQLTIVIISIVALINIVFLVFLHLRQPSY